VKPIEINGKLYTLTKASDSEFTCKGCAFDNRNGDLSGCEKTVKLADMDCSTDLDHVWELAKTMEKMK